MADTQPEEPKRWPGRPTKYVEGFDDMATRMCLLGYTNEELAKFLEIDVRTLYRWMNEHESFCQAVHAGRHVADAEVAESLYSRARGVTVKRQVLDKDGDIVQLDTELPPDTGAAMNWLKNRQPERFRDKQDIEVSGLPEVLIRDYTGAKGDKAESE